MGGRNVLGRISTRRQRQEASSGEIVEPTRANDSTPPPQRSRPPRATGPIDPGWLAVPTDEPELPHDDEATATVPCTIPTPPPFAAPTSESQPLIDADAPTVVDPQLESPLAVATEQGEGVFVAVPPVAVEDLSAPIHNVARARATTPRPAAHASQQLSPIAPEHIPRRDPSQGMFGSAVAASARRSGLARPSPALIALGLFLGAAVVTTLLLVVF